MQCSECNKNFGYSGNLIFHEKKCVENENKKGIKCPDLKCLQLFTGYALLRKHVEDFHKITINKQHYYFRTFNDYKEWKQKIEKESVCSYVSISTARIKNATRTYYYCHRSGYFNSKSQGVERIKSQGSNKIDSECTSSMFVTENATGIIHVEYNDTHFGHGSNLGRCRLTSDERAMIAGYINNYDLIKYFN